MAWEKRGGKTKELNYGAGPAGRLAAEADALRRAEREADEPTRRAQRARLDDTSAVTDEPCRGWELLAAASLLRAGYRRPGRHDWRAWRNGRRALRRTG